MIFLTSLSLSSLRISHFRFIYSKCRAIIYLFFFKEGILGFCCLLQFSCFFALLSSPLVYFFSPLNNSRLAPLFGNLLDRNITYLTKSRSPEVVVKLLTLKFSFVNPCLRNFYKQISLIIRKATAFWKVMRLILCVYCFKDEKYIDKIGFWYTSYGFTRFRAFSFVYKTKMQVIREYKSRSYWVADCTMKNEHSFVCDRHCDITCVQD